MTRPREYTVKLSMVIPENLGADELMEAFEFLFLRCRVEAWVMIHGDDETPTSQHAIRWQA